jgi:hypothetical protein
MPLLLRLRKDVCNAKKETCVILNIANIKLEKRKLNLAFCTLHIRLGVLYGGLIWVVLKAACQAHGGKLRNN